MGSPLGASAHIATALEAVLELPALAAHPQHAWLTAPCPGVEASNGPATVRAAHEDAAGRRGARGRILKGCRRGEAEIQA